MQTRRSVRRALSRLDSGEGGDGLVLVALSGGADSLALAAAVAGEIGSEATAGLRAGAIVVDHGLQHGSAGIAERAAEQARGLGLDPVLVRRASVGDDGGPEAAAREARYAELLRAAEETGARAILTAHTRDDQAEQVLLALARGSGTRSLSGIPPERELAGDILLLRPFLAETPPITRADTRAACSELGLEPWIDPHNSDRGYARVRVREELLPLLERELGGGVSSGLARSADLAREDADALDAWAASIADPMLQAAGDAEEIVVPVEALAGVPAAVRQRAIHRIARSGFGSALTREHTLAIAALVTAWRGQGPIHAPGIRVARTGRELRFERQLGSPRDGLRLPLR